MTVASADLAAGAYCATGRTEITAILADHRVVATLATELALRRQNLVAGRVFRCFEDTHLLQREAAFVEDAEHRIAVDDQVGNVGNRGGIGLLLRESMLPVGRAPYAGF